MSFQPHRGDLLFQGLGFEAITNVTQGYRGAEIDHVGVYVGPESGGVVVEAIYPAVRYIPLRRFLRRNTDEEQRPRVLVGRPDSTLQPLIPDALREARDLIGLPYDNVFGTGEDAYYCSELIIDIFRSANGGVAVFEEEPMNFRDDMTGEIHPHWVQYFEWLGVDVPVGQLGSNPGSLSLSSKISIVHQYGSLAGLPLASKDIVGGG